MTYKSSITISVVSHNNINEVIEFLSSLKDIDNEFIVLIIITLNTYEDEKKIHLNKYPFKIKLIKNKLRKGFGANHNTAFKYCCSKYFLVINPDIIFPKNFSFYKMLQKIISQKASVIAPLIITNGIKVPPRKFPTIKNLFFYKYFLNDLKNDFWISGCFMLFDADSYKLLNGFDERFFLYMEDVDICKRTINLEKKITIDNGNYIIHKARRMSYQHPVYLSYHILSIIKYYLKHLF